MKDMDASDFISYKNGILQTICNVIKHEDGRVIHLLPVLHIGEKHYYQELMEYIGDHMCVYENIQFGSSSGQKLPTTFDEWLHHGESNTNTFYQDYQQDIKRFQKHIITKDIKQLRNLVKTNLSVVDDRITTLFYQIENNAFSITNMGTIQAALAELMGLSHQLSEIDYINDIPSRKTWIHGDLDIKTPPSEPEVKTVLSTSDPDILDNFRKQAKVLYWSLYWIQELIFMDRHERRANFAQKIMSPIINGLQETLPDYLIQTRNNILIHAIDTLHVDHDEVVAFYGLGHMADIGQVALNEEFQWHSKTEFTVFSTKGDTLTSSG